MPIWTKLIKSCAISALLTYLAGDLIQPKDMKRHIWALRCAAAALILTFFPVGGVCQDRNQESVNREIFAHTLEVASGAEDASMGELTVRIAESFMGTPYVAGTLEVEPEALQICMDKTDCILFVEMCTCLALTYKGIDLTAAAVDTEEAPSYELFCRNVQAMRYRRGIVDGYASRLHYTSEWIIQAEKLGIMEEFSAEIGQEYEQTFSFMSGHPDSYAQMKDVQVRYAIAAVEKELESHAPFYYVPQDRLREEAVAARIHDGDLIFFKSKVKGLDITHVAIARRAEGQLHFIHASSKAGKVILEPRTLADYAANGIRVARLKCQRSL